MKLYSVIFVPLLVGMVALSGSQVSLVGKQDSKPLGSRAFSLENRYGDRQVNEVMKDNILLSLAYLRGLPINPIAVDWESVRAPFEWEVILDPGRTFAFQNDVALPYRGTIAYSTNAHFSYDEGFKSDGYLMGDGVCHVASLIYWAASDAALTTNTPVAHDFAQIPQVPQEYGVSIYSSPGQPTVGATQNLYVTNNRDKPMLMKIEYSGSDNLTVSFLEMK